VAIRQPDIDKAQAKLDAAKDELSKHRSATVPLRHPSLSAITPRNNHPPTHPPTNQHSWLEVTYAVGFEALSPGKCEAIFGSKSYLEAKVRNSLSLPPFPPGNRLSPHSSRAHFLG
jgi:hypothetical protein